MGDKSKIEWTESTWNPVTGCSKVSQGCKNCYAERDWRRLSANPNSVYYGRDFTEVQCHPERLQQPLRWVKPRQVFVNSMSDLFHPDVPFEFIAAVFAVMSVTTRHTYQILTKRPERMLQFFEWAGEGDLESWYLSCRISDFFPDGIEWTPARHGRGGYDNCGPAFPYENVWLGVSVEDQATADERIPLLLQTPAAVRWVSMEPLLGPISLAREWISPYREIFLAGGKSCGRPIGLCLKWVVVGGESGPNARPMHSHWAYSLRDQCVGAGVPFFFKQWGGANKKAAGRELDGRTWDEMPEVSHGQ